MGPPRKKQYFAMPRVKDFMDGQSDEVRAEYNTIIGHLEADGLLKYPVWQVTKDRLPKMSAIEG